MSILAGELLESGGGPTSLELQDPENGVLFFVVRGGLDDVPTVRGKNVTIPGKPGQTWMPKVEDSLPIILHGYVEGQGSSLGEQRQDYLDLMARIKAVFDPTAEPFEVDVYGGAPFYNEGLADDEVATIMVEFLRLTGPTGNGFVREFDLECRCISDPPAWVVEGSS